jgi:hypothetical protein
MYAGALAQRRRHVLLGGIVVAVVGACAWAAMDGPRSTASAPRATERLADDVSPAPAESFLGTPPRREGTELPVLFAVPPFDVREARGGTVSQHALQEVSPRQAARA